jgi:dTDP-3-amino-2,3,6-trideoxy-4-keto-D-glucose/dTDP-3-amino-3,4,6-trideoxy-alpha-D-glucose/dTDP-2,6-dideoxy-D-kanosamine transaminase
MSKRNTTPNIVNVPLNDLGRHVGSVRSELLDAIRRVADSGWFILGPETEAFETSFAEFCGVEHCIGVANGSDALVLALKSLGCGQGDEVATVANAGGYASIAIMATGAKPVYIDIEANTLNMSSTSLRDKITLKTKAVVVTHLYGRLANMVAIEAVTRDAGALIVEDCAQAHGAQLNGRRAGSFGKAACFSFYPSKNLGALGDAGAVVTDDAVLASSLRKLRQYGWSKRFQIAEPGGCNSRLDELQAAALSAQLPRLSEWNEGRRRIVERYREALAGLDMSFPGSVDEGAAFVAHLCVVRSPRRDRLREELSKQGIATDIHYPIADYDQISAKDFSGSSGPLPETERALSEIMTLPCFPEMTDGEFTAVVVAIRQAFDNMSRH